MLSNAQQYSAVLTDVVVLVSGPKLEAQAEGREQLELLGELERSVGALRSVALPAFEALPVVVAGRVAVVIHHVQHVVLHALGGTRHLVVRTVDVQVVVDRHLHRVLAPKEPEEKEQNDVTSCSTALTVFVPPRHASSELYNFGTLLSTDAIQMFLYDIVQKLPADASAQNGQQVAVWCTNLRYLHQYQQTAAGSEEDTTATENRDERRSSDPHSLAVSPRNSHRTFCQHLFTPTHQPLHSTLKTLQYGDFSVCTLVVYVQLENAHKTCGWKLTHTFSLC